MARIGHQPSPVPMGWPLLGGEALAGVEADGAAVEHGVLDDGDGELAVLVGATHALGEGSVLGELTGELVGDAGGEHGGRSEEHTSELQSLMRISYSVFCLKNKQT